MDDHLTHTLQVAKQSLWQQNSHLSDDERNRMWSQRRAQLISLIGVDGPTSAATQADSVPRSLSWTGPAFPLQTPVCMPAS